MTSIQDQAAAAVAALKTPLTVDAGGTVRDADGSVVLLPHLQAAHMVVELANKVSELKAGPTAAKRFMQELLDSVETLSGIAEEHGARTLADLFFLHSAIAEGSFIDYYPNSDESSVKDVVEGLPSAAEWLPFIKTEYLTGSGRVLPDPNDFPAIVVGQQYEFHAEMQEAELPAPERMRNYTGQKVTVISGPEPKDDPESSDYFVVKAADGRQFTAAEEELNGWDKALGQYYWPDGTYGPNRDDTFLVNERIAASKAA